MSLWTYLLENAHYYLVTLVTLFLWDIIDLYIEFKNFSFIRRIPFIVYYVIIGFFSIAAMEAGLLLNLFTTESKYLISFFIPLIFAIVLENLVVKIGGVEKAVDFSEFFDKFRFAIREHLDSIDGMRKVAIQAELLNSDISTAAILWWCRFYSTDEEMKKLAEMTKGMDPTVSRIEIIKQLIRQAKTADIIKYLRMVERSPIKPQ